MKYHEIIESCDFIGLFLSLDKITGGNVVFSLIQFGPRPNPRRALSSKIQGITAVVTTRIWYIIVVAEENTTPKNNSSILQIVTDITPSA